MSDTKQTMEGVGILVAAFPAEADGEKALNVLKEAKELKYVRFEDAALIRQDADGGVHYHETGDMSTGKGSGIGALIGGVIGILGGPIGIVAAAGAGAVIGGTVAHGDAGFKDKSLEQLGAALKPGTSAIALTTNDKFLHAVRKQANDAEIRTAVSNLSSQLLAKLQEGKNIALGINLSEEGLIIKEVAVNDKLNDLIGVIAAKDGVIGDATVAKEVEQWVVAGTTDGLVTGTGLGVTHEGNLPG